MYIFTVKMRKNLKKTEVNPKKGLKTIIIHIYVDDQI